MIASPSVSLYYLSIRIPQYVVQNGRKITLPLLVYQVGLRTPNAVGRYTRDTACAHTGTDGIATYHFRITQRTTARGVHVNGHVAGRFTVTCRPSATTL